MSGCAFCGGKGLIRVAYQSGEPFDIAMCDCREGRWWRWAGEAFVRKWGNLEPENQVAHREDFDGDAMVRKPAHDYLAVGKTKKAKL